MVRQVAVSSARFLAVAFAAIAVSIYVYDQAGGNVFGLRTKNSPPAAVQDSSGDAACASHVSPQSASGSAAQITQQERGRRTVLPGSKSDGVFDIPGASLQPPPPPPRTVLPGSKSSGVFDPQSELVPVPQYERVYQDAPSPRAVLPGSKTGSIDFNPIHR